MNYSIFRAKCHFSKIYDLREGIAFLNKIKSIEFQKAAKEMAITMRTALVNTDVSKIPNPHVLEAYMALIDA